MHFRFTETRFKTRDLIGYYLHGRHQIIPVANEIARFKSPFAKTEEHSMGVACHLRFNVRVPEGSGK